MDIKEDKNTRFYIDLDLKEDKIVGYGYDDKKNIIEKLNSPYIQRVFITRGQYNKMMDKKDSINIIS